MEWTPEVVQAEVQRRHEAARHQALVRQVRAARGSRPSWWRRLRMHEGDRSGPETELGSDTAA